MVQCPQCGREIVSADFNVSTDLAYCRNCDKSLKYSDLIDAGDGAGFNPSSLPRHLRIFDDGSGEVLRYRRISPLLFFFIPFTAMWSGMSMFGLFKTLMQKGFSMDSLFFLPFFLGTLALLCAILYMLFGKVELRERGGEWTIFTGVGPLGYRRRFFSGEVVSVRCEWSKVQQNHQQCREIVIRLKDGSSRKFGVMMRDECRDYICNYLKRKFMR